jgi:hypothetical protein
MRSIVRVFIVYNQLKQVESSVDSRKYCKVVVKSIGCLHYTDLWNSFCLEHRWMLALSKSRYGIIFDRRSFYIFDPTTSLYCVYSQSE